MERQNKSIFKNKVLMNVVFGFTLITFSSSPSHAGNSKKQVSNINKEVTQIIKQVKKKAYSHLNLTNQINFHVEGAPPSFKCYYNSKNRKIVMIKMNIGHEIWSETFYYFFDKNEKILKYLQVHSGYPGQAATRKGIIYSPAGKILWQNVKKEKFAHKKIKSFFKMALSYAYLKTK